MKMIKSAFIVLTVALIAAGASYSFFGDTESSTGNTFTAGKIDLKVDSEAHYNGLVCKDGAWTDPECSINKVSNWDFETPAIGSGQWNIFPPSATDWQVEWMNPAPPTPTGRPDNPQLEYHNNLVGTAQSGQQYVELDSDWDGPSGSLSGEPASVRIYQDVPTVPGKDYTLSFWFSRRPDASDEATNKMRVTWGGSTVATNLSGDAGSINPNWKEYSYTVHATAGTTRLAFEDIGTADSYGTYLDNVSLVTQDCEVAPGPVQTCDGTWALTDIGAQKFFNFTDIKPGDYGEDTVSLHVYDNDAWGRLKINNITDIDNSCVEPELNPVDPDCLVIANPGGADGELRENIEFSVWLDEGDTPGFQGKTDKGEGDNIRNYDELLLVSPGPIDLGGETHNIWQGIAAAYVTHGCLDPTGKTVGPCQGLTADGHMVASTTYYFGIGWELPGTVGNEVQTDIFSADMTFEVSQYRNNPSQQF